MKTDIPWLFRIKHTSSTMSDAKQIIDNVIPVPDKFAVVAETQLNGKGREGKIWFSGEGGLWITFCLRLAEFEPRLTLLTGYWLMNVVSDLFPDLSAKLAIKWPNDLFLNDGKLAGILIESYKSHILVGVGTNTNNEIPEFNNGFLAANLKSALGFEVSNQALLNCCLYKMEYEFMHINENGIRQIITQINKHLYLSDSNVEFDNGKEVIQVKIEGIAEDGALILTDNAGIEHKYIIGSIIRSNLSHFS